MWFVLIVDKVFTDNTKKKKYIDYYLVKFLVFLNCYNLNNQPTFKYNDLVEHFILQIFVYYIM